MIPKECKRLAEVDFPIAIVSKHAAREKGIRHGHPSTLHLWWARRPLASSRAILLGLLWPDPCDPLCPHDFKAKAREVLPGVQGKVGPTDEDLRSALLKFIGDFANWDLAANPAYLEVCRVLVRAVYPEEPPLVLDPFAGGGSIPLEALRVGADTFASDLNPVAGLILKVMLEDIPRYGPGLAVDLRLAGDKIKAAAETELREMYPLDSDGGLPLAYLWARTVRCETPDCGAEIPLVRSLWLSTKESRPRALRLRVDRTNGEAPRVEFEIYEPTSAGEVKPGTVSRANATCPACRTVLPAERVRAQLAAQRGGADVVFGPDGRRLGGARMLAVVSLRPGEQGRKYRLPADSDYAAVQVAARRLTAMLDEWDMGGQKDLCPVPNEPTPAGGGKGAGRAFNVQKYGIVEWGDLFTARQKVGLAWFARAVDRSFSTSPPIGVLLGLALGKTADLGNAAAPWKKDAECPVNLLGSQRIKPSWDWAESVYLGDATASFSSAYGRTADAIEQALAFGYRPGSTAVADARVPRLPADSADIVFTDPPYYDAIPYAALSDFFIVWLKRINGLRTLVRDPLDPVNQLSNKKAELIVDEVQRVADEPKDRRWFELGITDAFSTSRRTLKDEGIGAVVFAHKTTEGWEALLSGIVNSGWQIAASWPLATEMPHRPRARESAALATSVHLICRPRPDLADVGDWADVLRELPNRVAEWMSRLQREGVRGADLVFACIGPALEIFSRHSRVETAEGRVVSLAEYLEKVWEVVGRSALNQILGAGEEGAGALEEDARLTALFLWTFQSTNGVSVAALAVTDDLNDLPETEPDEVDATEARAGEPAKAKGYTLIYDVVRRFAQPLGIHLDAWEGRIIDVKKGAVRLLPLVERRVALLGSSARALVSEPADNPSAQLSMFGTDANEPTESQPDAAVGAARSSAGRRDLTTLDRVHVAMLLQRGGQAAALRNLLSAEQDRGPEFLRLANALSALYPRGSEEKRLLDAMLLAVPR